MLPINTASDLTFYCLLVFLNIYLRQSSSMGEFSTGVRLGVCVVQSLRTTLLKNSTVRAVICHLLLALVFL